MVSPALWVPPASTARIGCAGCSVADPAKRRPSRRINLWRDTRAVDIGARSSRKAGEIVRGSSVGGGSGVLVVSCGGVIVIGGGGGGPRRSSHRCGSSGSARSTSSTT